MDLGLAGRTALVPGSTSGLGRAVATTLAAEGARVVVLGRRGEVARDLAASLPDALGVEADLTDATSRERAIATVREEVGRIDILVLNGGGPAPGTARDVDVDRARAAMETLLTPHIRLVETFVPAMVEGGWGRIVAIGSSGVQQPIANLAASNLGRAALAGYLKTLAGEVAGDGVTVNMVLPGRIATDRLAALDEANAERSGVPVERVRERSIATIPAGRYGRAEEFAALVAFVASDRASYLTGEQIRCDGGLIAHH